MIYPILYTEGTFHIGYYPTGVLPLQLKGVFNPQSLKFKMAAAMFKNAFVYWLNTPLFTSYS